MRSRVISPIFGRQNYQSMVNPNHPKKLNNESIFSNPQSSNRYNKSTVEKTMNLKQDEPQPEEPVPLNQHLSKNLDVREAVKREINKLTGELKDYKGIAKKKINKLGKLWLKPVEFNHIASSVEMRKKFL